MSVVPSGYEAVLLPTMGGPVMAWQCQDCAALLAPGNDNAATHDRFHDRITTASQHTRKARRG